MAVVDSEAGEVVIRVVYDGPPEAGKTTSRIRMLADTAISGQIFFRADFSDGTSAIYSAVVPEPGVLGVVSTLGLACLARRRRA